MTKSIVSVLSEFAGDSKSLCIFGGGGGSDQETARLLAVSLVSCKKHSLKTITVITAFAPLYDREGPHQENEIFTARSREQTKLKYTGKPFKSWQKSASGEWEYAQRDASRSYSDNECVASLSEDSSHDGLLYTTAQPVEVEGVTIQSYGLVVVPPSEKPLFEASRDLLQRLLCPTNSDIVEPILLVDTGGDGMKFYTKRSLPAGAAHMGDVDVTAIYGGVSDSRDTDSLRLCLQISRKKNGKMAFLVVGPGADGESSTQGLTNTHDMIRRNGSLVLEGSVAELIGIMDDHTSLPERHLLKLWLQPRQFSTIAHITEAVKLGEHKNTSMDDQTVTIRRQGVVVGPRPASFLSSFWLISGDILEEFL
ncbi:hypothetical protein FOL47_007074 [Perkinsus chesapeaki]|uniref:Uncharacterized protein n=1 Tax=Perkinsus chesapeaki TaxID=330153 RepID=A0A7J6LMX5_PERCH|nr:hypothetical protein FOL47_007074 [Perkinsus chesapeaki]